MSEKSAEVLVEVDASHQLDLERVKRNMKKLKIYSDLEKEEICSHPGFVNELCIKCGLHVQDDSAIPLKYIHKKLRIAKDEMVRLRDKSFKDLVCHKKKLYLVLDLDHTLLHSIRLTDIKEEEKNLIDSPPDTSKSSLFKRDKIQMITKLRPFVHTFLEEASKLFEMYMYTLGSRDYALEMAKLLDPKKKYFHSRIISRHDCISKNQKSLDIILGRESTVLIVDDTERVWENNIGNLILIERYYFFTSTFGDRHCLQKIDESEVALASVLKVLQRVHTLFFDKVHKDNIEGRDVRKILEKTPKKLLKDCYIFIRVTRGGKTIILFRRVASKIVNLFIRAKKQCNSVTFCNLKRANDKKPKEDVNHVSTPCDHNSGATMEG